MRSCLIVGVAEAVVIVCVSINKELVRYFNKFQGNDDKQYYGIQFHPEVTHTLQGQALLGRFVHQIGRRGR